MSNLHQLVVDQLGDISGDEVVWLHNQQAEADGHEAEVLYLDSHEMDTIIKKPSVLYDAIIANEIDIHHEWFYKKSDGKFQSFDIIFGEHSPINKESLAQWIIDNNQLSKIGMA